MASGQGTATVDFGAFPGSNEASVVVTGIAAINSTSGVEAFVMADDTTADHTANDHRYFNAQAGLTCGTPTTGVGFTIYENSAYKLTGTYAVRYVWADV
jgi:hypothetical protein